MCEHLIQTGSGSQTLKCGLRDFEAFEAFQKALCYSFPTPHCNNQTEAEQGYYKP